VEEKERKSYLNRLWTFLAFIIIAFLILGFNLWRLQVANAEYYAEMAQGNFMHEVSIPPMRGDIVDRNGIVLATSEPEFALTLDWLELQNARSKNWKDVIAKLAEYVKPYWPNQGESVELIMEDILVMIQSQQWERYRPITILRGKHVTEELQAVIAEHANELPGVRIEAMSVRTYPQKTLAGQVLGYVREIDLEEIDSFNSHPVAQELGYQYRAGDMVGKMGVEKSYDIWLRGEEGLQQVIVDNSFRPIAKQVVKEPKPGKTVQLTLDAGLQRVVEQEIDRIVGFVRKERNPKANAAAAVVMEVKTGKILAMASRPYMDPNELIGTISDEIAEKYFRSEEAATFNRAIQGIYPPGSTYKMLVGMAALELGVTTPNEYIDDRKSSLGPPSIQAQATGEWGNNYFGRVNLRRGLAKSSNIYFQAIGRRVFEKDPEYIRKLSHEFGLGVVNGIDIPGESRGIAPSAQWKKDYFQPYYDRLREKQLAEIEQKYAPLIAAAKSDRERQALEQKMNAEKNQVEFNYQQNLAYHVNWRPFDSFNNAIGQGYNAYTILQLANYVSTIVNGGVRYKPYIVDKIIDPVTNTVVYENKPEVVARVSVSPETLEIIKDGMRAVLDPRGEGTANFLFRDVPEFSGGGKTGTAQIQSATAAVIEYNGMFVAFAPYDDPEIAFAGFIGYGESGGDTAGYVAKAAFMHYFGWGKPNEE